MRRPVTLTVRVFSAIVGASLLTVLITGVLARRELSLAFERYLVGFQGGGHMPGRGMGRMLLGAAEQQFLAGVDRGILVAAVVAVVVAAVAAVVLSRQLSRPLSLLTDTTRAFAAGDLDARALVAGPAEVGTLAEAFNDMADSLATTEMLRRRMVADVAHELRDPIAALRAQVEGLADGVIPFSEQRARSLAEDIADLSRLVSDLQELSIAEAGALAYEPVEFDLAALLQREVERAAVRAESGMGISLVGVEFPVEVVADERRIAQVLRNLLGNASGHAGGGEIRAIVEAGPATVTVAVEDSGAGIPVEALPYVFERFYRADSSRSRATGGVGIGLAIVKRIVEDHGGEVFAGNMAGGGARVGFTLPRRLG